MSISFYCNTTEFTSFYCISSFPFFFCIVLLSIITEYEFDKAFRDFHATVDHATAMFGYENARLDLSLDGRDYDAAFSILEALGNDNPEDFVKILRDLFWDDDELSMDGRRLGFFKGLWHGIKCAGTAVGTGLTCTLAVGILQADAFNNGCPTMVDHTKNQC